MTRLLFGAFFALFAAAFWTLGQPPAASLFYERAQGVVVSHERTTNFDGWFNAHYVTPLVRVEGKTKPYRLLVEGRRDKPNTVVERFPVGTKMSMRLGQGKRNAYPAGTLPLLTAPAMAFSLVVFWLWFGPLITKVYRRFKPRPPGAKPAAPGRGIAALFALAFSTVGFTVLSFGNAAFDPPLTSIFWERGEMRVDQVAVEPYPVGNGTTAARLNVTLANGRRLANAVPAGTFPARAQELAATHYAAGRTLKTMTSPTGQIYERRWRFSDLFGLVGLVLTGLCLVIAVLSARLAFT
ncbi:MAG: hypothetical protein AAGK38_00745 [Pseudomonadota bacterium]